MSLTDTNAPPEGAGLTPIFVNRYHLWARTDVCRIIVGDAIDQEDPSYKFAFVMTTDDAKTLANQLLELIGSISTPPEAPPAPPAPAVRERSADKNV
jgi:hypothetical protein